MDHQVSSLLELFVVTVFLSLCEVFAIGFILDLLPRASFLEDPLDSSKIIAREIAIVLIVLGLPLGWIAGNMTGNYAILFSVLFAVAIVIPQW